MLLAVQTAYAVDGYSGVHWNKNTDTYTRLGDGTQQSDFDSIYPWNGMYRCNLADDGIVTAIYGDSGFKYDGSNGQVMVRVPAFYYKVEQVSDGYNWYIWESLAGAPTDYKLHPSFMSAGVSYSQFYIGAFDAEYYDVSSSSYKNDVSGIDFTTSTGDKLSSVAGYTPVSGMNNTASISNLRILANNRGWQLESFQQLSAIQILYLVEYANFNSQSTIGQGVIGITSGGTNRAIPAGYTAGVGAGSVDLGNTSGSVTISHPVTGETTYPVSYRGIENMWGNIQQFIDGVNIYSNHHVYISDYAFQSDVFTSPYTDTGIVASSTSGNVSYTDYTSNYDYGFIPYTVGGTWDQNICDYYNAGTGNCVALAGGALDGGSRDGLFNYNLGAASSTSNRMMGTRISYTAPSSIIQFTTTPIYWANRADNSVTLTVRVAGISSPITVDYSTADGDLKAGTNYTAKTGTLTFNTDGTQTITINLNSANNNAGNWYSIKDFYVNLTTTSGVTIASNAIVHVTNPPGIAFTFDDWSIENWYNYRSTFDKYDADVTFYISNYSTEYNDTRKDMLRALRDDGHEIASHSLHHRDMPNYVAAYGGQSYLDNDVIPELNNFSADGFAVTTFAYPGGNHTDETATLLLSYFRNMRGVDGQACSEPVYYYWDGDRNVTGASVNNGALASMTTINSYMDAAKANHGVVIFFSHDIVDSYTPGVTTPWSINKDYLEGILANASAKGLKFYTMNELSEPPGSTYTITTNDTTVAESDTSIQLNVTRTGINYYGILDASSITINTIDGSAAGGSDFTSINQVLNFAPAMGINSTNVVLSIKGDVIDEDDETFTVALSNPTGNATLGTPSSVTITIISRAMEPLTDLAGKTMNLWILLFIALIAVIASMVIGVIFLVMRNGMPGPEIIMGVGAVAVALASMAVICFVFIYVNGTLTNLLNGLGM